MSLKTKPRHSDWNNQFQNRGLRFTKPRKTILKVLSTTKDHPSAEEIYLKVHKGYPDIGLTTVYRTLDLLIDMGIVYQFRFGDGRSRYELIHSPQKPGHHHHLICISCKKIIDYDEFIDDEVELLKKIERGLSKKYNFNITNHMIEFQGTCGSCKK